MNENDTSKPIGPSQAVTLSRRADLAVMAVSETAPEPRMIKVLITTPKPEAPRVIKVRVTKPGSPIPQVVTIAKSGG